MWLSTHYFSGLLQDWFHVFLYEIKNNSVWYNFYHGTSVSITFYIFEHYQLWMMDSKGQRVFFPKTPQLCVWHTEVRRCYHFKLVSHFQLWFPIWGVLVNRLTGLHSICHVPYATLSISFFIFLQCPHLYICIVCMYICLNCIYLYLNVYCQCLMLTVCTKGLRVTQFQFSVCMFCTCGRIDNKEDLTWLDLRGLFW